MEREEAVCAILIEREYRMNSDQLGVAHQRKITIVQDQPLSVHARRQHGVVLVLEEISKDNDLHIVVLPATAPRIL
jgi:hypothetical protein